MGSQVQCKSYFPGYFSMRDLNEDSNSSGWPLFYGDKSLMNGQFYNGYMPRSTTDACTEYDKDALKQKILEHEAIFRNQVYELHRLYRIQRDMMEDVRRKEVHKWQTSIEPSSSSSLRGSQIPSGDTRKWQFSSFPLANSGHPGYSTSGVDIGNSPLSCTKGGNTHAGPVSGSTSKDCEVLEFRPSKVRKKLFDLQLPADEYMDAEEGEPFRSNSMSKILCSLPNGDKAGKHDKFFLNGSNGERIDRQRDVSTSESCQRSSMRLADLNEPIPVEDGIIPSSVDHGEPERVIYSVDPSSQYLALQKEKVQNGHRRNFAGFMDDASVAHKGKGRDWLCDMYEPGLKNNNLISVPHSLQQDQLPLPSKPLEVALKKGHQSSLILPTDYTVGDFWREKIARTLEAPDRIHDNPNSNHLDSNTSLQTRPYQYFSPSELANSWSHSALSWGKPTGSLTEKPSSFPVYPSMNLSTNPGKTSQSSALSHSILGEKWQSNGRSRLHPGSVDIPITNGFHQGSSSGSKEMLVNYPSIRLSHLDCNGKNNDGHGHLIEDCNGKNNDGHGHLIDHKPEAVLKGADYINVKPLKPMDLNVVHSKSSSNEAIFTQDVEVINEKRKPEGCLESLPWLRAKPSCRSEAINLRRDDSEGFNLFKASPSKLSLVSESSKDFNRVLNSKGTTTSNECENYAKKETGNAFSVRKILGVPIYDNNSTSRKETSSSVSTSVTRLHSLPYEEPPSAGKKRVIDINLACDEEEIETEVTRTRMHIDLNCCLDEDAADEEPIASCFAKQTANKKIVVDIDLEVPVIDIEDDLLPGDHEDSLQSVEPKHDQVADDLARVAAEAMVSLSSSSHPVQTEANPSQSSEHPLEDSLVWLADAICGFSDTKVNNGKEVKTSDGLPHGNYSCIEMDDFEIMTLQLEEIKEEEYMPKPFVHEVQDMEELGSKSVHNRGRRGQTRRGRQRRDFQRDILPGLSSLSRQEVTEDLQTFSGLMKANGQTWSSALTRRNGARNGGARGRRRAVVDKASAAVVASVSCAPLIQQLTSFEASLEDRSLTGWGKTTRRPRRQRCPPGNPPAVPLT